MNAADESFGGLLDWCAQVLGPVRILSDDTRAHPGDRSGTYRLASADGVYFLKVHADPAGWHNEVHAYGHWAAAFGERTPRLLAVRKQPPLALIISELPGRILDGVELSPAEERAVWAEAGAALAGLHRCPAGAFFGPALADGASAHEVESDPQRYLTGEFEKWLAQGVDRGWLSRDERRTIAQARGLLDAFAGERPTACHRDYGPANWLVHEGCWSGVIDYEFAHWDVRVADFTRYPNWEWMTRPDLIAAFDDGYGESDSPTLTAQKLVGHALYALAAVVWGEANAYFGFAAEGRVALARLRATLG